MPTPEERAWERLQRPYTRGKYEHPSSVRSKINKRASFLKRLARQESGCWLWFGTTITGPNGEPSPIFYHWRDNTTNTTRSAFMWMMREWFPEVRVAPGQQTVVTCGNRKCLSPYHRRTVTMNENKNRKHYDKTDVLRAYDLKGHMTPEEAAKITGLTPATVRRIWIGARWSSVTGEKPSPRRLTPDRVMEIYEARESGKSMAAAAKEFKVGVNTLRQIWLGYSWTHITGASPEEALRPRISPETKQAIMKLKGSGRSAPDVAQELGCSVSSVLRYWRVLSRAQGV